MSPSVPRSHDKLQGSSKCPGDKARRGPDWLSINLVAEQNSSRFADIKLSKS